eukprot:TRINITY_DN21938_c0_g1_i4.p1 TRINITY_DN21938_c0_g1~~TRINITY_DN21938_c0_g1_i4.p1  ORF type:complete len:169 (+),score=15.11 TRINITY_DN21938_c0_g1_i4:48-554(+)
MEPARARPKTPMSTPELAFEMGRARTPGRAQGGAMSSMTDPTGGADEDWLGHQGRWEEQRGEAWADGLAATLHETKFEGDWAGDNMGSKSDNIGLRVATWNSARTAYSSEENFLEIVKVIRDTSIAVSYTHLRAHETPEHLVCRLLLEKKKKTLEFHHYHLTLYTKSK